MFKKKEEREKTRIEKRVARLSTPELLTWSDQVIYSIGRNLSSWQKTEDRFHLDEARVAAESIHAILDTLSERYNK
jgi:hypothetical protein